MPDPPRRRQPRAVRPPPASVGLFLHQGAPTFVSEACTTYASQVQPDQGGIVWILSKHGHLCHGNLHSKEGWEAGSLHADHATGTLRLPAHVTLLLSDLRVPHV